MSELNSGVGPRRTSVRVKPDTLSSEFWDASLSEASPLGIKLANKINPPLAEGDPVEIEMTIGGEQSNFKGVVTFSEPSNDEHVSTIRYLSKTTSPGIERRDSARWICPSSFLPLAVAPTPGQYNDFLTFRVRNISRNGLELRTDVQSRFLVRGMLLRLSITLPLVGETVLLTKIVRIDGVSTGGTETLILGTEIVDADPHSRDLIAQYLVQFCNIESIEEMRPTPKSSPKITHLKFSYLRDEKDYRLLLQLSASVWGRPPEALHDIHSRIALVKSGDTLIGAVGVLFPNQDTQLDWAEATGPRIDQIVAVSEIVMTESVQSSAATIGLLSFVSDSCVSSQRPYVVVRVPIEGGGRLLRYGFIQLATTDEERHKLLIGHPTESVVGRTTSPLAWNLIWRNAAEVLVQQRAVTPQGLQRRMLGIYRRFSIVAYLYTVWLAIRARFR